MVNGRDTLMLTIGGSIAVHVILMVMFDAAGQYGGPRGLGVAPRIEMIDIETTPPPPPPPPPPAPAMKSVEPEPTKVKAAVAKKADPPPDPVPTPPVPPDQPPDPNSGGAPVVAMKEIAPAAKGVAVARGTPSKHVGQGGTGTGTGSGTGAGSAAAPKPMSVATIKKRAMPKGDYSFDAAKDYPPQAKAQGIEGQIRVRLLVDASGKVAEKRLLNKLGYGLDELALARAAKFEFDPALDSDDRPVASVVVWTFTFTLPE